MLGRRLCVGWNRLVLCLPVVIFIPHLLSVDELHRRSNLGDVHIERPTNFLWSRKVCLSFSLLFLALVASSLVLDPELQVYSRDKKSIEKHFVNLPFSFCEQRLLARCILEQSLTIESRPVDLVTIGNTSYSKLERSLAILSVFINFIQVAMPQSNKPFWKKKKKRLEKLTQKQEQITHFIFTDSDIAVIDDLGRIFNDNPNFDLALTFRKQQTATSKFGIHCIERFHFKGSRKRLYR
ncbi:hypothetical protein OROMI_013901 [Orobanche minor]